MRHQRNAVIVLAVLFVAGCASSRGFDRGRLRSTMGGESASEDEIQAALDLKPQVPVPFKLAIYMRHPQPGTSVWNWLGEDKDKLVPRAPRGFEGCRNPRG